LWFHILFAYTDPASVVNEASVHRACLLAQPWGERALRRSEYVAAKVRRPKICDVCGGSIDRYEDYFTTGAVDEWPGFDRWAWFQAHRSCVPAWRDLGDFVAALAKLRDDPVIGADAAFALLQLVEVVPACAANVDWPEEEKALLATTDGQRKLREIVHLRHGQAVRQWQERQP
jgi:hypothetical protein